MTEPPLVLTPFIEQLLAQRIGLDIASVGTNLIEHGLANRMRSLGVTRLADYERILLGPTDEVQALIEEVVIPESWFFRDDRPFAAFRDLVRDGWLDHPQRSPLRVLCLPCASGEEPYSVVITLLEQGLPRDRFAVTAIDISERSLVRAARGIYGAYAFRGVADTLRDKYFDYTETAGRYLLKAAIRAAVRFERGNILDLVLLGELATFDVIFCRNLLIYFDEAARGRAFQNLDRLATPDAYLFLGHADRPDANLATRFTPHGDPGSFLYRKQLTPAPPAPPPARRTGGAPPSAPRHRTAPGGRSPTPAGGSPSRPLPREGTPPPARPLDPPAAPPHPPTDGRSSRDDALDQARTLADQGRYGEATTLIRGQLGRGMLDAPAHFLLGVIHQAAGDREQAETELLKAVYLDPSHDEALLGLALLTRRRGDMAAEALWRRRAERVRARKEEK